MRGFLSSGIVPRPDARCPVCGALERARLVWPFYERRTRLLDGGAQRMLHIAPEAALERRLRAVDGLDYVTADLNNPRAMVRMDITSIQFADGSFDVVHCSHVLEHVPDDRRALAEMFRVLKTGGFAVLQVPVLAASTTEDPTLTDPAERLARFGQEDHVRVYGPDFEERVTEAGFVCERLAPADILTPEEVARFAVPDRELIFYCRRMK